MLAPDYGTTGWLAFYLPAGTCVVQQTQRIRWVNMPEPDPAQLAGKLLYVDEVRPGGQPRLKQMFARVEEVAELPRKRGPLIDRDLRARSAGRRQGRCARSLAAAGTGVGGVRR